MAKPYGYCEACGKWSRLVVPGDHIVTQGSGGCDCAVNVLQICRVCHALRHTMGVKTFYQKSPDLWARYTKAKEHEYRRNQGLEPGCNPKWASRRGVTGGQTVRGLDEEPQQVQGDPGEGDELVHGPSAPGEAGGQTDDQ